LRPPGLGALIIDLVGSQDHRLSAAAQHLHHCFVDVLGSNGCVHHKNHGVRRRDGKLGLLCDPSSHSFGIRSPTPGVHQHELTSIPGGVVGDAVSGHAWDVLYDGLAATDHPVHQG
jgi:hypothetical protein